MPPLTRRTKPIMTDTRTHLGNRPPQTTHSKAAEVHQAKDIAKGSTINDLKRGRAAVRKNDSPIDSMGATPGASLRGKTSGTAAKADRGQQATRAAQPAAPQAPKPAKPGRGERREVRQQLQSLNRKPLSHSAAASEGFDEWGGPETPPSSPRQATAAQARSSTPQVEARSAQQSAKAAAEAQAVAQRRASAAADKLARAETLSARGGKKAERAAVRLTLQAVNKLNRNKELAEGNSDPVDEWGGPETPRRDDR